MNIKYFCPGKLVFLFCLFILVCQGGFAQPSFDEEQKFKWADNRPVQLPANIEIYASSDLVIMDDVTEIKFMTNENGKITRHLLVKINSAKGLINFQTYKFPESFDLARDAAFYKQGRRSRIKIPYTNDFKVKTCMVRTFSNGSWKNVTLKEKYEQVRWIGYTGEFGNEDVLNYHLQGLKANDVVEIYYEATFKSSYGENLFYFNSAYPKLNCEYTFTYPVKKIFGTNAHLLPVYIKDSLIRRSRVVTKDYYINTDVVTMKDLKAINYPANSFEGRTLPHVYLNFQAYSIITASYPTNTGRIADYDFVKPKNFEWMIIKDTTNYYTKIYDKQFASIRKFVATLPPIHKDSANTAFFKALCDTFNNFRYITNNHLFYNESNLFEVSSGDHLLKRRLVGHYAWSLWTDILNDNKIFYYTVNVQDKRYGEHSIHYRAHYAYEAHLIAIPSNASYNYFMPRYNGIKYHLNELPFYYEGVLGALEPKNFQENIKNKENSFFKFIKTHKGTYNENTRTENATFKISMDSLKAGVVAKESLSGQFSTILRHLYLDEYIDSTISPYYFKKCTAKPGASGAKIKLSSKITEYPFRYTFNCSEKITLQSKTAVSLENWFSFPLSKATIPEIPTHDYYIDFEFSDSYNFLLDFGKATEFKNAEAFSKMINNDLFELESTIIKNSESSYLLKVKVVVKQSKVTLEQAPLLMELINTLDGLNSFSLEIS